MSIHFHPLRIREIRKETPDCVSLLFEIPDHLKEAFQFSQGQSLTMRTKIDGEEQRRTYSICSSPMDNEWRVAVKKVEGGLFSVYANTQLKEGDVLDVMPPVGKFYTPLHPGQKKHYLAFAAGSGITPVISIIKTTLAIEKGSQFTLVYGNRSSSSVIFFEELEALKNKYIDRFNLIHIFSRESADTPLNEGWIDKEKLQVLDKLVDYKSMDETFICGPEEMIFCVRDFLLERGLPENKIHFELFSTSGGVGGRIQNTEVRSRKSEVGSRESGAISGAKSKVTIKVDGRSIDFEIPDSSDISILDAALKKGADLPYACKGGMCCTCKAKLVSGQVEMDVHWGLEQEEIDRGYILTCQSHPRSETVSVDFDAK